MTDKGRLKPVLPEPLKGAFAPHAVRISSLKIMALPRPRSRPEPKRLEHALPLLG